MSLFSLLQILPPFSFLLPLLFPISELLFIVSFLTSAFASSRSLSSMKVGDENLPVIGRCKSDHLLYSILGPIITSLYLLKPINSSSPSSFPMFLSPLATSIFLTIISTSPSQQLAPQIFIFFSSSLVVCYLRGDRWS